MLNSRCPRSSPLASQNENLGLKRFTRAKLIGPYGRGGESSSPVSPSASSSLPRLLKSPKIRRIGGGASLIRGGGTTMLSSTPPSGSPTVSMISSSPTLGRDSPAKGP